MTIGNNESMMAIFSKHIGKVEGLESEPTNTVEERTTRSDSVLLKDSKKIEAEAFSVNAKNSNEAIGMLQSAKKSLNKVAGYKENMEWVAQIKEDPNISQKDKRELLSNAEGMAAEIKSLLDNTTFMGKKVFGSTMNIDFGREQVNLEIKAPSVPQNITQESVKGMFDEGENMLKNINGAIKDIVDFVGSAQKRFDVAGHDFNSFQKDSFKNMF